MRKGFIVRDRSLSSLPSKQLSVNEFMAQKSIALQTFRSKVYQQSKILNQKQQDITKLKTNLDHALKLAVSQAIQSTKAKQQSMRSTQTKIHIQKKYLEVTDQLNQEKMSRMKLEDLLAEVQYELTREQEEKKKIREKQQQLGRQLDKIRKQLQKIPQLQSKLTQIQPLKHRIKTLESSIRQQKIRNEQIKKQNKQLEKCIEQLNKKIKSAKPYQEQLLQRIALLERVNLELERKMEDFNRRQHDYKKEVLHYKGALAKMTIDRNKFKSQYQSTYADLQQKLQTITQLQLTIVTKTSQIQRLTQHLSNKTQQSTKLSQKLHETIQFYKTVDQQNAMMKRRVAALQQNQEEMRRTLAAHVRVSEEINLYIVGRNAEVMKLEDQRRGLIQALDVVEKKFSKLDRLFDEQSARGATQIKQSYYSLLKQRNKFALQTKQAKQQLGTKILQFGQQRDILHRKLATYIAPSPSPETLYQSIIADKIEEIVMLESSNDQLVKVKKEQEERIREFQRDVENMKKEMYSLRLKAAELFKCKKDLQQSKSKCQRYQDMIQQQKNQISDLNSQLDILRLKNSEFSQKNYAMSMDNKNLTFKLAQYQNVMKQLDIEYLNGKKIQNQKNAHILADSLEKLQNGINSLAYYFSCCFCGDGLVAPVTLAICGHNYCAKCKDAYSEYCYQCDTGQEIQRIYSSKYLKQAAGKYKFLVMVMKQAQTNMIKIIF